MATPYPSEREIFLAAIEKTDPRDRNSLLRQACGNDPDLTRRVEALLKLHDEPDSILDQELISLQIDLATVLAAPELLKVPAMLPAEKERNEAKPNVEREKPK